MKRHCVRIVVWILYLLSQAPSSAPQAVQKEVIVIGGGISGLAAARQLVNKGRANFTVRVYEARRERYGGRVWTSKLKNPKARGLEVDLGATALNVLHPFTNPLLNLTTDFDLETATLSQPQFIVPWQDRHYSGDDLVDAMKQAGVILTDAINTTRTNRRDISVREAVDTQLKQRGVDEESLPSLLLRALPSYITDGYSALLYQPDSLDFGYERMLLDGMGELLDRLASGSEDELPLKISLRTPVRQVKVDKSKDKVILRLRDGSQVTADRVIVAVPTAVIAKGTLLFEPDLPADYQKAAKDVGISHGNKVIVHFKSLFWYNNHDVFILASETAADRGFLQTWLSLNKVLGKPVLVGMAVGEAAKKLEELSDAELREAVLERLGQVFGKENVADDNIDLILRSAWTSDQWAGGASTFPKVGNSPKLLDTFAEPLCPYIYFAGEHTVFRGHGSLHGAYLSGVRAADQLLSGYCEQKAREIEERKRQEEEKRKKEKKEKPAGQKKSKKEEAGDLMEGEEGEEGEQQEKRDEL